MKKNDRNVIFSMVVGIVMLTVFSDILPIIMTAPVKAWQSNRQKNIIDTHSVVFLSQTAEQEYEVEQEIILKRVGGTVVEYSKEKGILIYENEYGEVVKTNLETGRRGEIILINYGRDEVIYSRERGTIVYRNERYELVEKKLDTGREEILNIPGMEEWSAVQRYEVYFQYTNNGYDLSFCLNDAIYLWERDENRVIEIVGDNGGEHQWLENGDLLFTRYIDYYSSELRIWHKKNAQVESIEKSFESFILSEDESILYGVERLVKDGIRRDRIIEKNLQTGKYRVIMDKYKSESSVLALGEGNKLFYIEAKGNKRRKIICVDTETGKARQIYRSAYEPVEIIVK